MQTVFTTDQVHARDRFDYWHSVACQRIVEHETIPADRSNFAASIEVGGLGNLELVEFHNSPMQVSHTLAHSDRARPDQLFVCYQVSGSVFIAQNAREVTLSAGNLTLIDPLLPYDCRFLDGSKTLVVKVPRLELRARLGRNRELVARIVRPVRVDDSLTLTLTAMLPSLAATMAPVTEEMVGNHAVDLIALSIARTLEGETARVSSSKAILLARIRTAIDARLTDSNLHAQDIADAVGISVRYANELLSAQDTSIMQLVLARRLARCRFALEDPHQGHRTVSEIAYGWGFGDLTHFGRKFKAAYGTTPSECQMLARRM
ncbi:helix-turn-helix domain-containing protein [Bradyrhizobium stylosanthis]|uniref:AraC-like DNA-binding protein n=1 Tax=Bradyrhizobium stylosanthis TaxID=1803665 RepID=A0A560DFI0_9BRAD|nr:helix-turn-helix domain-containing protein [Bradyrhizobium stylosanthis]TWA95876.1 AraC-like DNA-binding protein [Bradyrhizobium stylosanthis]